MKLGEWSDEYLKYRKVGILAMPLGQPEIVEAPNNRAALRQLIHDFKASRVADAETGFELKVGREDDPEGTLNVMLSATLAGLFVKTLENILGEQVEIE